VAEDQSKNGVLLVGRVGAGKNAFTWSGDCYAAGSYALLAAWQVLINYVRG
jgi:hypothetical protein